VSSSCLCSRAGGAKPLVLRVRGITGLKTGSDTAAGGCVLLAAWQQARGHDTLIVAATFGQPGTMAAMLPNALQAGHQLVLALDRALAGQSAH